MAAVLVPASPSVFFNRGNLSQGLNLIGDLSLLLEHVLKQKVDSTSSSTIKGVKVRPSGPVAMMFSGFSTKMLDINDPIEMSVYFDMSGDDGDYSHFDARSMAKSTVMETVNQFFVSGVVPSVSFSNSNFYAYESPVTRSIDNKEYVNIFEAVMCFRGINFHASERATPKDLSMLADKISAMATLSLRDRKGASDYFGPNSGYYESSTRLRFVMRFNDDIYTRLLEKTKATLTGFVIYRDIALDCDRPKVNSYRGKEHPDVPVEGPGQNVVSMVMTNKPSRHKIGAGTLHTLDVELSVKALEDEIKSMDLGADSMKLYRVRF